MPISTPNMNLPNPVPGIDAGIGYALSLQSCFLLVDQHNHSSGNGQQIQPNGLNISSDLSFLSNNATSLRTVRFASQITAIPSSGFDVGCLYVTGNELYYNDVSGGHQVPITNNGNVNAGAGSITGMTGTTTVAYVAGTFKFQSATNIAANIDAQTYVLRNSTASSHGLTLQAPVLSTDYSITLPALPGSVSLMALDAAGNISAPYSISGGLNASVLTAASITATQIAPATIIEANMAPLSVGTPELIAGSVTQVKRAAATYAISSSSGVQTLNGGLVAIAGLSSSITTVGRPVVILLTGNGTAGASIQVTGGNADFQILRNSSVIQQFNIAGNVNLPPSVISYVETPPAGVNIYTLVARVNSSSSTVSNVSLVAYEL